MPRRKVSNGSIVETLRTSVGALIRENRKLKLRVLKLQETAANGHSDGAATRRLGTLARRVETALSGGVKRRKRRQRKTVV